MKATWFLPYQPVCVVGVFFKAGINLIWEKVLECIVPD